MRVINRTTLSIYRWLPLIFCILWGGCKANSGPTAPTGETLNSVPVILTPLNGAQVGSRPEFRVQNVSGGGGARTYQFEISESPLFLSSISDAVSENSSGTTVYRLKQRCFLQLRTIGEFEWSKQEKSVHSRKLPALRQVLIVVR